MMLKIWKELIGQHYTSWRHMMMKVDELMSESQMCELLGIKDESAPNTAIPTNDEQRHDNAVGQNVDGAAIPSNDEVPGEMVISYDKNKPSMEVGTVYPNMEEFKLAVRHYIIKKKFDIKVEKSCKTIYRAFCKSGDEGCRCPWRINGRKIKGTPTMEVTILVNKYQL